MRPRSITFTVYGVPQPKGSARGFVAMKAGKARAIVTTDNKSLRSWEAAVRFAAQGVAEQDDLFEDAVRLQIAFFFVRPKSVTRPHMTTRPDLSKLIRATEDALNGVVWTDDALVTEIGSAKRYARRGKAAHAVITITEVELPFREQRGQRPLLAAAEARS